MAKPGDKVTIAGITATVMSEERCEQAAMVLCVRLGTPSPFTDNQVAPCALCGFAVIFRPYMPKAPPKVCMECALAMMADAKGKAN